MTPEPDRKYVRVYYSIVNDERFATIFHDARHLGTWLQLLLVADAMFPADAPIPAYANRTSVQALISAGLIEKRAHSQYRVHGLASERELRSQSARTAAAVRWQSGRNADPMPRRDETRLEEQRRDNARDRAPARARETDPVGDALFGAYNGNPSQAVLEWGDRLGATYGAEAVSAAIGTALMEGRDRLLSRAEGALKMAARRADQAEREAEAERVREGHRPVLLSNVDRPDPEKVESVLEDIAQVLGRRRKVLE